MNGFIRTLFIMLLLIAGFWFGVHWGMRDVLMSPSVTIQPVRLTPVSSDLSTPKMETQSDSGAEDTSSTEIAATDPTNSDTSVVVPPVTPDTTVLLPTISETEKTTRYENKNFKYAFDIPTRVFYSGFGPLEGARHTVGISASAIPDTLDVSEVQVYYFGDKVIPELQSSKMAKDPSGTSLYILVDGHSFRITGLDTNPTVVSRIAQTLSVSE